MSTLTTPDASRNRIALVNQPFRPFGKLRTAACDNSGDERTRDVPQGDESRLLLRFSGEVEWNRRTVDELLA